jgi:hypothetical protein
MNYLIFSTLQLALNKSQEICISQGCTGDVTTHWFGCISHPITGQGAMQVSKGEDYIVVNEDGTETIKNGESVLTEEEILQLKDYQFMYDNGWFSDSQII